MRWPYNGHLQQEDADVKSNDSIAHGIWHGPHSIAQLLPHREGVSQMGN